MQNGVDGVPVKFIMGSSPMKPEDLDDPFIEAVHAGAVPIALPDRPQYYSEVARALSEYSGMSERPPAVHPDRWHRGVEPSNDDQFDI
jgi:hypothetical protein